MININVEPTARTAKEQAAETIDLPDNTVACMDDVSIPHTWYSVDESNNELHTQSINTDGTTNWTMFDCNW